MRPGEISRFTCPNAIDNGGNEVFIQDSHAKIRQGTDVTYQFQVISCTPEYPKPPPRPTQPMMSEQCVYIVAAGVVPQVAMTVDAEDKYKGSTRYKAMGIYDVGVQKWDGDESDNKFQ